MALSAKRFQDSWYILCQSWMRAGFSDHGPPCSKHYIKDLANELAHRHNVAHGLRKAKKITSLTYNIRKKNRQLQFSAHGAKNGLPN